MRLFVAINFDEDTVEHLYKSTEILRKNSISANISRRENLHLTLAFIGEVPSAKKAIDALSTICIPSFELILEGYGEFGDGRVCFAKTVPTQALAFLAEIVRIKLIKQGLEIDTKPFKPHITLARQLEAYGDFDRKHMEKALSRRTVTVNKFSLMRSDRVNGRLTYTEVFSVNLP